jgi:hypothetical protein
MRNLAVVLVIFLGLFACSSPAEQEVVTPEVDIEKVVEAANQFQGDWDAAFNARDLDTLVGHYLEDAVRMHPEVPAWKSVVVKRRK